MPSLVLFCFCFFFLFFSVLLLFCFCFGCSVFCVSIQILGLFFSISMKNAIGILIGIALHLQITLSGMDL